MSEPRFYYINEEAKEIKHFGEQLNSELEGFVFAGMSELPIKGAAGYYAKNQPGYRLIDGDAVTEETQDNVQDSGADVSAH
ncbi:hypothetical protein [uncultured Kiloniella sp.]|uniref:hypothetical protein n=1 Tax=uncultured Kiloniella sp. TaxID=1133091 RepID=UPI00262EDB03|nr:hypothetical protein [uncultured Kiloniella sp.]